jgi:hypothetical protein
MLIQYLVYSFDARASLTISVQIVIYLQWTDLYSSNNFRYDIWVSHSGAAKHSGHLDCEEVSLAK